MPSVTINRSGYSAKSMSMPSITINRTKSATLTIICMYSTRKLFLVTSLQVHLNGIRDMTCGNCPVPLFICYS